MVLALLFGLVEQAFADSTIVITPSNMGNWSFHQFAPSGNGSITDGPGIPPLGSGSAMLNTNNNGGIAFQATGYESTHLNALTRLQYSSYRATFDPNNNRTVTLQLEMDYNIDDPDRSNQGWLVYEPYRTAGTGTVMEDAWYTWDALAGRWVATTNLGSNRCTQSNPCTISQLLSWFPNAGVRHNGTVRLAAGASWGLAFTGYADALIIGVSNVNTTYNFENNDPPSSVSAGGPYSGAEGVTVSLDGTASDPDGDPLTYAWSYTPGPGVDPGATCSFADPAALDTTVSCSDAGDFTLILSVDDGVNPPVTSSTTLTLSEANPTLSITSPSDGASFQQGSQVDVSADVGDAGNDSLTCTVDWGDGTTSAGLIAGGVCSAAHVYDAPGDYTITVTVTDDDGGSSSQAVGITVFNDPPTADAGGPYTGDEGWDVSISASASDPESDPLTYAWSYTPGPGVDPGATCSFADPAVLDTTVSCSDNGLFTITLTVDDGSNPPVSDSSTMFISNLEPVLNITAPVNGAIFDQGQSADLSARLEDAADNDTLACQVDWGDGTIFDGNLVGETCSASHTYTITGDYNITVTVSDDDSGSNSASTGITILNVAPTIDITNPSGGASFSTGGNVEVAATVSDPGGDEQLTCTVDWGDGATSDGVIVGGVCTASHVYDAPGDYTITATITDQDASSVNDTVSITVTNQAPTVQPGGPYTGGEGRTINLVGFASDPEGDYLTYAWDYTAGATVDSGTTCTFANPSTATTGVSCTDNGSFTLTLTVDDGFNPPVSASVSLTLGNRPPVVNLNAPVNGNTFNIGETVNLSATFTDSGSNDTHTCTIAWGDGTTSDGTTVDGECTASYSYITVGEYTVTVTIKDDDNRTSSDSATITINTAPNSPPVVDAGSPFSSAEGQASTLTGSATDLDDDPLTYIWSYTPDANVDSGATCAFGDPASPTTIFLCTDNGTFTVNLTVNDGNNPPVSDTASITINNLPPVIVLDSLVNEPLYQVSEDIPLNALITDPGLNDIQVCQVDWGDGTTTDGLVNNGNCTASYAYTFEGEYTITVTATDDDGGSGSDSAIVIISGEPQPSTGAVYLPLMTMDWNSSR